jgi:GT2 family glycosyltransferase
MFGSEGTPTVDIIIVNWNSGPYLAQCLDSIRRAERTGAEVNNVVVVDNGSNDDSLSTIGEPPLPLTVLRNAENQGYAAACNRGAAGSTANYLLFLNADTQLFQDSLTVAVNFMEGESVAGVAICGGQIFGDGARPGISCARFPSLRIYLGKMTGLARLFPRALPPHHLASAELHSRRFVDQVIGAFFFIRRSVFSALEGFDERYFLYMEDVDLSLRAKDRGYTSYFLPELRAYHKGNVSTQQVRDLRMFYQLQSRTRFARQHWPRWQVATLIAMSLTIELPVRLLADLLSARWRNARDTASGYRMYLWYLSSTLRSCHRR